MDMGGGSDIVDRDAVGGDETGEVEELVEVALRGQWDHDHRHLAGLFPIADGMWVVGRWSHRPPRS